MPRSQLTAKLPRQKRILVSLSREQITALLVVLKLYEENYGPKGSLIIIESMLKAALEKETKCRDH